MEYPKKGQEMFKRTFSESDDKNRVDVAKDEY